MRGCGHLIFSFLLVFGGTSFVSAETNTLRPLRHAIEAQIKLAEANVERIMAAAERLTYLQETATNDVSRSECIRERLVKINGLIDLTKAACARLPVAASEDKADAFESDCNMINSAWDRTEKLAAEAEKCVGLGPSGKPRKHFATTPVAASNVPQPLRAEKTNDLTNCLARRPYVARPNEACLAQKYLARYLVRAMDISWNTTKSPDDCVLELTKLGIAPLAGWHPDQAARLDDLCVILARALKLAAPADDAASCTELLRQEGLPIDAAFPGYSVRGDAPGLLDDEVREFFASGFAAPLPRARRL
jgi:hypothetical protein